MNALLANHAPLNHFLANHFFPRIVQNTNATTSAIAISTFR